jgi:dolichol kinase
MAAMALVFNLVLLPRVGGRQLYRPVDHERGFPLGILLYPVSVLLLILAFPARLDIAAAAWGVLAFGDGFATLIGRRTSEKTAEHAKNAETNLLSAHSANSAVFSGRLPWNPDKSIAGTLAFMACGSVAGVALAWWVRPSITPMPTLTFTIAAPLAPRWWRRWSRRFRSGWTTTSRYPRPQPSSCGSRA